MANGQTVHIVEDDPGVGASLALLLQSVGLDARLHGSVEDFLNSEPLAGCVVSDIQMPGMSGLDLLDEMKKRRIPLPVILMTGFADVPLAVKAMRLGAVDFIEKPFADKLIISSVQAAMELRGGHDASAARKKFELLTARERDVLAGLVMGKLNKIIAYELGVSVRTVETHRANLMTKTRTNSLSELIRMALLVEWTERDA